MSRERARDRLVSLVIEALKTNSQVTALDNDALRLRVNSARSWARVHATMGASQYACKYACITFNGRKYVYDGHAAHDLREAIHGWHADRIDEIEVI